jgi:hypothetical protein
MKKKLILVSTALIGLFLLIPFAQAASSQVWFDESDQLVWNYLEQELNTSGTVLSTNSSYRKLNFTDIIANPDSLEIEGDIYAATEANITTYGYEDDSIWMPEGWSVSPEIEDAEMMTHFASFFNEINADLTYINSLPAENQTMMVMMMVLMLDPSALATLFVYILVKGLGGSFALDTNSSTINSVSAREINADLDIQYGDVDGFGVWSNITFHSNNELTYGQTSNVLLKSVCTSTLSVAEGNSSGVTTDAIHARFTHEIVYPSDLVNDYPPSIPGFAIWIIGIAIVLGSIPAYLAIKRKK